MLAFFPTPYPDELLYSVFSRYHVRSRNSGFAQSLTDLFTNSSARTSIDLQTRLDTLYEQLPRGSILTPENLMDNHTLLPLFKVFWSQLVVERMVQAMRSINANGNRGILKDNRMNISSLRYCSSCVRYDEQKYGEPYWHRSHHVLGVEICCFHDEWLTDCYDLSKQKRTLHSLDADVIKNVFSLEKRKHTDYEKLFAQNIYKLLNNRLRESCTEDLNAIYFDNLRKMNYVTASGKIRKKELCEDFEAYYGFDFLEKLNSIVNVKNKRNWLSQFLYTSRDCTISPTRHVLLMIFLRINIEELLVSDIG